MGTADYCALIALLLAGLIALSIRQEECRCGDRRQQSGSAPGGIERRVDSDRRNPSWQGWVAWAARSQWRKVRNLLHR